MGRKQQESSTVLAEKIPVPMARPAGPNIVHHHGISWASIILIAFFCLIITFPLLWLAGIFLLDRAGIRDPEQTLAESIIILVIGLPVLLLLAWAGSQVLERYFRHREVMKQLEIEQASVRALTAGAPALADGRLTDEDKRLFENLAVVMEMAYNDLKRGPYKGGNTRRPWSKASVLSLDPPRYGRMPYSKAALVREWLAQHQVITGEPQDDQVNTTRFPTWADFRAMLENEFNMPVVAAPASGGSNGYVHLDE